MYEQCLRNQVGLGNKNVQCFPPPRSPGGLARVLHHSLIHLTSCLRICYVPSPVVSPFRHLYSFLLIAGLSPISTTQELCDLR